MFIMSQALFKALQDHNVRSSMYEGFIDGYIRAFITEHHLITGQTLTCERGDKTYNKLRDMAHLAFELYTGLDMPKGV